MPYKEKQNIPEGWKETTLGGISKVVAGFGFPVRFQGKKDGKYLFAKVSDMNRFGNEKYISYAENYLDEEDLKKVKVKTYPVGTVIFPKVGAALMTNKRRILNKEALIDNNIMGLIPTNIDSGYLYYWMLNFDVTKHVAQGALPSINQSYVEKLGMLLPESIIEQKKIAGILEAVDVEIEQSKSVIKATKKLKKGLMKELFTRGVGHMKFKQSEIGEIPESWEIVSFDSVVTIVNGQVDPKKSPYKEMILVAPNHIEPETGYLLEKVTAGEQKAISGKYFVKSGAVVYSKIRPYLQKAIYADEDCICSADMYPLDGGKFLINKFLFYLLFTSDFIDYANSCSARTGIPKLNREELSSYTFAMPGIVDQKEIVQILSAVDEKISVNKKLLAKQTELKKGLMQDLLSGSKRVNVK